ncbi:30S ribosomal protein S6 [Patescibacteria group bacterium]|nr:30S ribosomal protein S6 [Patescibacteria group bacterium]
MEKENIKEKGDTAAVYEVSYLLLPSLAIEQVPAKASSLKEMLTSAGGLVISDENPVLIDLAYPMTKVVSTIRHKVTTGYFGWVKFEMSREINTEGIVAVKKALDADDSILRYLIVNTVRENTLLTGKMKLQKEDRRREDEEGSTDAPKEASPEELDKSIEDLVIA